MGIDGLYKFINKNLNDTFKTVSINDIKGRSCIIDGMQHIYSQLIYMRSRDKEIISEKGDNISHIHGLINSLTYYLKNGIIPIFIFDGKSPDIKKNKISERRKNLKDNLSKLKELEKKKNNLMDEINSFDNDNDDIIFGTPPIDLFNLEDEIKKYNNIQEEYKKIYKKSIVLKDYFITDWIEILEFLGLPVIKATGEADPVCSYIAKNNRNIYGIISDDSDMLIFGAPLLMRKSINQQFVIIELDNLIKNINNLLFTIYAKDVNFSFNNLVDFSILLGSDYGNFKLNSYKSDSLEILKYFAENNFDYTKIISEDQYQLFNIIKDYYNKNNFDEYKNYLNKPLWNKPNLFDLKKRLLELYVDEDYIDKNNEFFDNYYNKKIKIFKKNKQRAYSFDTSNYSRKYYFNNSPYYKKFEEINNIIENNNKYNNNNINKENDNDDLQEIFKIDDT